MISALDFFLSFGLSLFVLCITERIIKTFLCLFCKNKETSKIRASLVIGGALNLTSNALSGIITIIFRCAYYLGWLLFWYAILFGISSLWLVIYEDQPEVVIHFVNFYNKRIGPFIHGYLIMSIEVFNLIFKGMLPLYNGIIWIIQSMILKGFLPILWDVSDLMIDFSVCLFGLGKSFSTSVVDFIVNFDCPDIICVRGNVLIDVISPMNDIRKIAIVASKLGNDLCSTISVPLDFFLYPLIDIRLAKSMHGLLNSVFHLVFHIPHITTKRCKKKGLNNSLYDIMLCTPDMEPAFEHAVSGVREFGGVLDNWLGLGAAMARKSLTGLADDCTKTRALSPDRFKNSLLTGQSTVVGLTDWLMATTNNTYAYFFGQITSDTALRVWPEPVDVGFGIAAVSFDEVGEVDVSGVTQGQRPMSRQTTSIMGCRCIDSDKGVIVRCNILPMSGGSKVSNYAFDVLFQDQSWSSRMTCSRVEISVRSVRWPVRRYEGKSVPFASERMDLPDTDCMSRGTCESVDATIWLVPRCDLLPPEQCSDVALGTSCFPFCMAARISGSRDANPVFVNAQKWRTGKQLLMRDCTLKDSNSYATNILNPFTSASTISFGKTTLSGISEGTKLFVSGTGDGTACVSGVNLVSWIPSNATQLDSRSVPSYVRRKGQPFAIAGDTILMEFKTPDGASVVEVDRLSGDQKDTYTLVAGWAGLPTAPKKLVPVQELLQEERSRVVVPLDYVTTRIPSTSSRNYVFYGLSPDLKIFEAYMNYCRNKDLLPQAQIMMLSSYSALRVYRIRAYCTESCESGELSSQFTFDGFSGGKFTTTEFPQDCSRVFNASIDGLEYVNEQNIAVTVQVADKTYDPVRRSGSNSTYVTYWLNPQTMRVKRDSMWSIDIPTSLTTGLCIAGDGVPHLGSLAAELVVSGLHVFHKILGVFLYTPGMIKIWQGGGKCPLQSYGHSVMASCGQNIYSLDDFFDSLDAATAIFWGIPVWISEQLDQGKTVDYSPVSDILRGLGAYGRGTVGILDVRGGVMSLLNTPIPEQLKDAYALVRQPGIMSGTAKILGATSSWARYSARFFFSSGVMFAQRLVRDESLDIGEAWRILVSALYDQRPYFKSTITDRAFTACLGLQVMVNGANPWGRLIYHSCTSSALLFDGLMDVFLHLFVDAPMVKCVCKDSEGRFVSKYAREKCIWKVPQTLQPTLLGIISASDGTLQDDSLLCPAVIAYTRSSLEKTMRPYFSSVYASMDALGDSMDYLLSGYDLDAGRCNDFRHDPQVVVIMPEPVDYFQSCGRTSSCKTKCAGTWEAFSNAIVKYKPESLTNSRNIERKIDSLFFPSIVSDMIAPGKIVAISTPDQCGDWICRSPSDDCLSTASIIGSLVKISYFCIPSSPSSNVYASEKKNLNWESDIGHDVLQMGFLLSDGTALGALTNDKIFLLRVGSQPKVVLDVQTIMSLPFVGMYPLRLIDFMSVHSHMLVNVAVRTSKQGEFERDVSTIWFHPLEVKDPYNVDIDKFPAVIEPAMKDLWRDYATSEYPTLESANEAMVLLWPLTSTGSLRRVNLKWTNSSVSVVSLEPIYQSQSLLARATMMPRKIVLSKTLKEDPETGNLVMFASTGSVYDWLRQLRLVGSGLQFTSVSLTNSQPVTATISVSTTCNGMDCRGCPNLGLRSLCSAYQSCSIFRCVGTPVNLKRPLCGVGKVLKSLGLVGVEQVQGVWVMFIDIFMILLQLNTINNMPGVQVSFPDDAFLGNICAIKDVSAEFLSIITATVNTVLQRVQSVTVVFEHARSLDASVNTLISMSMAATTGFLNQIFLAPVYMLAVGHKIIMCQVNGMIAKTSSSFRIEIQPAEFASTDSIGGQCLTMGAETDSLQTGDSWSVQNVGVHMAEFLMGSGVNTALRSLGPLMHVVDGVLTYMIGITGKLADVLQTTDTKNCILPDVTLKSTVRCACGDKALSILPTRRKEGLNEFAYWCTGTLSMVDTYNHIQLVWNPYTYQELQNKIGDNIDKYLEDVTSGKKATVPEDPVFTAQGVSMMAVLTRCRQNYVNEQWDIAAFARYNPETLEREIKGGVSTLQGDPKDSVGECLLDSASRGIGNGACLDNFLRTRGYTEGYWGYTFLDNTTSSSRIDACLVFSGPASNTSMPPERRRKFKECLGGYVNGSNCDLSGFVWSPASANDVPVAAKHPIYTGNGTSLDNAIIDRMNRASAMVMDKLQSLADYNNPDLQAGVFSAEGDVIHQLLDCVFMGPYARMDYWPVPKCDEDKQPDCLVGPYWSRDASKGKSRGIDIDTCEASAELPFTCGSPTRKAMVKEFIKLYFEVGDGGADLIRDMIREWIMNQTTLWYDPNTFSCNCSGCCTGNLPNSLLNVSLKLSTQSIVNALEERVKLFYRVAMQSPEPWIGYLDSTELEKYTWSKNERFHQAQASAAFHPSKPTLTYQANEALSPPSLISDPGLWRACHSALKQMLFTMPMNENGELQDGVPAFNGGGPEAIASYVKMLVNSAKEKSPLFRHYHARHHPSRSRMCSGSSSKDARTIRGQVRFTNYTVNGNVILDGSSVPDIMALGFDAGVLGGSWNGFTKGLSDHLGFLDRDSTESWLNGNVNLSTSSDFLLRYGPGGLKVGNVPESSNVDLGFPSNFTGDLHQVLSEKMKEDDRLVPVQSAVLHGCDVFSKNTSSLMNEFVDSLFPMAQGVHESGVNSYCLRFAIELAMLQVMESAPEPDLIRLVTQKELAATWRRKCGTQVQLIGLCNALDMYHDGGIQPVSCLYQWQLIKDPKVEMYITPECLIKVDKYFYDPCKCRPDFCESRNSTLTISRQDFEKDNCKLQLDPRNIVQSSELGWWDEADPDPLAFNWNEWLQDPINLLNLSDLHEGVIRNGQSVGNTPIGMHWTHAEGFMNVSGVFCDMISDYWPEKFAYPVGYHVTTPCYAEDSGYRSFDNVFSIESGPDGLPRLVFMEDQTRDADLVDSHFGAGGLCRGTNFGFDMYETNTIRVCTRISDNEDVDIHVPKSNFSNDVLGTIKCSDSSSELPWGDSTFYDYYDSAFYSVGTVPNLPSQSAEFYPEGATRYLVVGPQHEMEVNGWGSACQDLDVPNCLKDNWKCPENFECKLSGVCQHKSVQCTQHSDCINGKMCSGIGTCETPRVSVENQQDDDISFRAHTTQCPGESFSMRGASYWGYVPDLLESHGMCSYRHWQEYLYTLKKCTCPAINSNTCQLKAESCPFYSFSKQQINNKWWNTTENLPVRLKMLPTTCDRDYERFALDNKEMLSCVPNLNNFWVLNSDGTYKQSIARDKYWKLYNDTSKTVSLRLMPSSSNSRSGFLGSYSPENIKSCMSVQQCYVDKFTINGVESMINTGIRRANRTLWNGAFYDPNDQFRCGVIGYYDQLKQKCILDEKLFPLYHILCGEKSYNGLGMCASSLKSGTVPAKCDMIQKEYDPLYNNINDLNVPALNDLFYVFKRPTSLEEHMLLVSCMNYIYDVISNKPFDSKGLYVPFSFTLYEIPFSWFYQCMIGSEIIVSTNLEKKIFHCTFHRNNNEIATYKHAIDNKYAVFEDYIFNVKGGYIRENMTDEKNRQLEMAKRTWESAIETVRNTLFQSQNNIDLTYPRCFSEIRWDLPNPDILKKRLIEAFVSSTCSNNVLNAYIKTYNQLRNKNVNVRTVISELTYVSGNISDQSGVLKSQRLLSGLIKQYGLNHLTMNSANDKINVGVTPITFDYSIPSVQDVRYITEKNRWKQLQGVLPNQVDITSNANNNDCNAEIKSIYTDMNGNLIESEDTDRLNGLTTQVQTCSVYATGQFQCSYTPLQIGEITYKLGYDSSIDIESQYNNYVDALYTEVKRVYDIKMIENVNNNLIRPIPMNKLKFYEDESNLNFKNFVFNLQHVSNYLNNINPDIKTPIMCVAGNQQIDYNNCTDVNFNALKSHIQEQYSKNGNVIIPTRAQLDWDISSQMMSSGAIFSFANINRDISKRYLNRLFDDESVCGATAGSRDDRLCNIDSVGSLGTRSAISPWLSGEWNPFDKCDVDQTDLQSGNTEKIDSMCYFEETCPSAIGPSTMLVDYYKNMPNNDKCIIGNNQKTQSLNVNAKLLYNLCKHKLNEDSICMHIQGMLGGYDGFSSESSGIQGDLYSLLNMTKMPNGDGTLFDNILLKGGRSEYGFLRISLQQIGGHQIGMRIKNGTMSVSKLPLKPVKEKSRLVSWESQLTSIWMQEWKDQLDKDNEIYSTSTRDVVYVVGTDSRGKPQFSWDCPLRRRAFYSGGTKNFKPMLPSARRSQRIFGKITGNVYAHPTQKRQDGSTQFGSYQTTNGFCFCPTVEEQWPGMCSVSTKLRNEHNCTLYNTVRALRGQAWAWSHTFKPRNKQNEYKVCDVQLDWPFVQGELRDGSTLGSDDVNPEMWATASNVESKKCHVLDRMPDFAYTYISKKELRKSGFTTLERGVCHTGRVQSRISSEQRCVRVSKDTETCTLRCENNADLKITRKQSKKMDESLNDVLFYRRLCSKCTPPLSFVTRKGSPLVPESSFGIPYKISAERMISQDLRGAICFNSTHCKSILNETAWTSGEFMRALLERPVSLFKKVNSNSYKSSLNDLLPKSTLRPDDSKLWNRNWVYCPTKTALKTGTGCLGTISKEKWRGNKVKMCYTAILESLQGNRDPFAKTDICNIDNKLTELCKSIREAQSLIASANCLRNGDSGCVLQEYVYNPSTWETTNQAFVHQTVKEFYMRADSCTLNSTCICGTDQDLLKLRKSNEYILKQCSAIPVMAFREVLVGMRSIVFRICKIISTLLNMLLNLLLMMFPNSRETATKTLILSWTSLKQDSGMIFDLVSDMFFNLIFDVGVLGPWLKENVVKACDIVNSGYMYAANVWCNLVVQQLPMFLGSLRALSGWMDVGFSVVNDVFTVILNDYLPNAMLDLYQYGYKQYFQSNRYRQKQAAYEKRVEIGLVNLDEKKSLEGSQKNIESRDADNKALKNMMNARNLNMKKTGMMSATLLGSIISPISVVGGLVDAAITGYQLYEQIDTAIKIKQMLEHFPNSFTIFDFDNLYLSIDAFVQFLNSDFTCYSMDKNVAPLQCTALKFTDPSADDIDVIAPRASACWAEVQEQQIGVSNLYACTASSSCCVDPLNCEDTSMGVRMCSECPLPAAGIRTYGCNTVIQRCQCGMENFNVDRCFAQRDCGPSASCSLLTSLEDVSFGALRSCTECSTSPICLMGGSQQYGQCTCLTSADTKIELCNEPLGTVVNPSPTRLCGYTKDPGYYFSWSELSLVQCINVVAPKCAEVLSETGNAVRMPVSMKMKNTQVAYSSRRLLSINNDSVKIRLPSVFLPDDPADDVTPDVIHKAVMGMEWNHTSAPCSTLAHAYKKGAMLGPVDESTLHSCVYWRNVARQLIEENNLIALKKIDTFLLSSGDFSASLGQRGVLEELMRKPQVLIYALFYSQYFKPVRAALIASHDANVSSIIHRWQSKFEVFRPVNNTHRKSKKMIIKTNSTKNSGRRLLGLWEETESEIKRMPYYSLVKATPRISWPFHRNISMEQYWLSNGIFWNTEQFGWVCRPVEVLVSSTQVVLKVAKDYYIHFTKLNIQNIRNPKFKDVIPKVVHDSMSMMNVSTLRSTFSKQTVLKVLMNIVGFSMDDVVHFFIDPCPQQDCFIQNRLSFNYLVESTLFCDFESVMFCTDHKRDMVMSTIFIFIIYVLFSLLCGYLGLYGFSTMFFLAIPFFVIWYSLGISPGCFPMIPTCLIDDYLAFLKRLFPLNTTLPGLLVVGPANLRPCSELGFTSWEDPLTYIICDMGFCENLKNVNFWGVSNWKFEFMHMKSMSGDANAYQVCSSVTFSYVIPILMLISVIVTFAFGIAVFLLSLTGSIVNLIWQTIMFNHTNRKK